MHTNRAGIDDAAVLVAVTEEVPRGQHVVHGVVDVARLLDKPAQQKTEVTICKEVAVCKVARCSGGGEDGGRGRRLGQAVARG